MKDSIIGMSGVGFQAMTYDFTSSKAEQGLGFYMFSGHTSGNIRDEATSVCLTESCYYYFLAVSLTLGPENDVISSIARTS